PPVDTALVGPGGGDLLRRVRPRDRRRAGLALPALLPPDAAPGREAPRPPARAGAACRGAGARRLGRRPVPQEPDRERDRRRPWAYPADDPLGHAPHAVHARRDRIRARP